MYTRTCLFIVDGIHFTSDGGMVCIVIEWYSQWLVLCIVVRVGPVWIRVEFNDGHGPRILAAQPITEPCAQKPRKDCLSIVRPDICSRLGRL